jgi:hypothetical protein
LIAIHLVGCISACASGTGGQRAGFDSETQSQVEYLHFYSRTKYTTGVRGIAWKIKAGTEDARQIPAVGRLLLIFWHYRAGVSPVTARSERVSAVNFL